MIEKNRKLRQQFAAAVVSSSSLASENPGGGGMEKGIFRGVSVFINGFTVPLSQELKDFMLKHGGQFENYFSRHRVTHIICSNLPDRKIKNFRAFSQGLPIVKPTWILDVVANKLLSWLIMDDDEFGVGIIIQPPPPLLIPPPRNWGSIEIRGGGRRSAIEIDKLGEEI
ncbi:uncharacterized protein A4U43_C08F4930 [Asparagus officinalis]|nr:uncharacterized protein A4U43_C08F4930 [Asparagus officinalis]